MEFFAATIFGGIGAQRSGPAAPLHDDRASVSGFGSESCTSTSDAQSQRAPAVPKRERKGAEFKCPHTG